MIEPCSGCGLRVPDGTAGCQAIADEIWARDFSSPLFFGRHRMGVDAYSLQHPDRYCAKPRSLAAHLGGLCCAFERAGDPVALPALQRWLSARPEIVRPPLPSFRGALTIGDVRGIDHPAAHARAVERWARSTWDAYAALQPVAREWVAAAIARRKG